MCGSYSTYCGSLSSYNKGPWYFHKGGGKIASTHDMPAYETSFLLLKFSIFVCDETWVVYAHDVNI